jgi:O-antigen/teichoic acid export membrane protein
MTKAAPASLARESSLVARGSIVNMAAMTMGAVLSFGLTVVAGRWLQPKVTGELFELIAVFTILAYALALGADTGLTRWIARARVVGGLADIRRIVIIALGPVAAVGIAVGVGVWVTAPVLARIFLHGVSPRLAVADFRLVAFVVPLGGLSICILAAARGLGRMWPYLAVEGLGKPALRIGLVVIALLVGWGLRGALVGWSVPVVIGVVAAWWVFAALIRKEVPGAVSMLSLRGQRQLATGFWRFAGPRGLAGVFQIVVLWLDILLVGALLSSYDAGVYAAVSKLAVLGTFALEGTRLAIAPQLSALLAVRARARTLALYQTATNWLMLLSWPVYVLFAIFPMVVLGIFGPRYTSGAAALAVLSLAMLVNLGTGNVTVVLLMGGKSTWNVANTLVALIINIGLNVVLLPRIGIMGAAIAWAASIFVDNVAAVIEVWWTLGLAPFGPGYFPAVAAAGGGFAAAGLAARLLLGQTVAGLGAAVLAGLLACAALAYAGRRRLQLEGLRAVIRPSRSQPAGPANRAQAPASASDTLPLPLNWVQPAGPVNGSQPPVSANGSQPGGPANGRQPPVPGNGQHPAAPAGRHRANGRVPGPDRPPAPGSAPGRKLTAGHTSHRRPGRRST